jgi:hypothetical protein
MSAGRPHERYVRRVYRNSANKKTGPKGVLLDVGGGNYNAGALACQKS